jgi:hypothetical protein
MSNHEEWKSVGKDAMIWSLNNYATIRYMEEGLFRENVNRRVDGAKEKIQLVLPDSRCYSLTQLTTTLDTASIGLISVSNYELTEFPSCRSVRILVLRCFNGELTSFGSYENLETLELTGIVSLKSIGNMGKLVCLSVAAAIPTMDIFPLEQLISFQLLSDKGSFGKIQDRFLMLEDLRLFCGSSFSLPTHGSVLRKLKFFSLVNYKTANLSGLEKLISLTVQSVSTLLGMEAIVPRLTILRGDSYFLTSEGYHYYPQMNEFVDGNAPGTLTVEQINQDLRFPVAHIYVSRPIRFLQGDLVLGDRVKSLKIVNIHFRSFQGVRTRRYFR